MVGEESFRESSDLRDMMATFECGWKNGVSERRTMLILGFGNDTLMAHVAMV